MVEKGYLFTLINYEKGGFQSFLNQANDYVSGDGFLPIMSTSSSFGDDITYSFSDNLFENFLNDKHKLLKKPFEVAMKYGFRGYSSGGKNGIFLMRKGDESLISSLDDLIEDNHDSILNNLETDKTEKLRKVKIVWHNNTGERMLGVYNPPNRRMLFLGIGSY